MSTFRIALALGIGVVLALGALGLFPLALVAAAMLLPVLTVIYLYDVDVYEDQPAYVIGLTMVWGALAGAVIAVLAQEVTPVGAVSVTEDSVSFVLERGVFLPALSVLLMLCGPLVLLRYRKFNDVLDGTTFGVASAAAFVAVIVLVQAFSFLREGLSPEGRVVPWLVQLTMAAIAVPILTTSVMGATAGALWLRYRAPVRDRIALGLLGRPLVAVAVAAATLVVSSLALALLPGGLALALLIALDALALVWLRQVIHIGLLEESSEIAIGPEIRCANCGNITASHTFCSSCGISLRALPKARRREVPPPPREPSTADA